MDNIQKIFDCNIKKNYAKMRNARYEFICYDNVFGAKQILDLIAFVNGIHSKYKKSRVPIYIFLRNVKIIDKLSYIILECICYSLIKDFRQAVSISWKPEKYILTQGVFSSPLALLNNNIAKASQEYIDKFNYEIYRYHFRKVVTKDKTNTNYLGSLQQDIYNFLTTFNIEEEYKDDIVEMIGEIVGNAIEHTQCQCLLDIDVTTDYLKSNHGRIQNGNYYGVNIVILNYSDILFGDKVGDRIKKNELDSNYRYGILKKAYNNHKKSFSDNYRFEDFCNIASMQHKISGTANKGNAGGRGLTTLIKSLQEKSDSDMCYMLSGNRIVIFEKNLLRYDDDKWIGFNPGNDFINNIPDLSVIQECTVFFPGTAYNLNFVLKREE